MAFPKLLASFEEGPAGFDMSSVGHDEGMVVEVVVVERLARLIADKAAQHMQYVAGEGPSVAVK